MPEAPDWWPDGEATTPPDDREPDRFSVDLNRARQDLIDDLERIKARDIRIDHVVGSSSGFPGVCVRWKREGTPYALACDTYRKRQQNMRAIGLTVRKLRHVREYGAVQTSEAYEGLEALPSGGDGPTPMTASTGQQMTRQAALNALNLGSSPDEEAVKAAYRELAKKHHPDGEDPDELRYQEIQQAKEVLLDG